MKNSKICLFPFLAGNFRQVFKNISHDPVSFSNSTQTLHMTTYLCLREYLQKYIRLLLAGAG
jgi:hypothetical protein